MAKSKRTRALSISPAVREAVTERDGGMCIWCGRPGDPVAHYISRAQGGLGIEQNILTLCPECHRRYDQSHRRGEMRAVFRQYLMEHYPGWDENELIYRR